MSQRRLSEKHVLAKDAEALEFPRSDGDDSLWPTNTQRIVDSEGQVNYMRPVDLDEAPSVKWRSEIGTALALAMKMPGKVSLIIEPFDCVYIGK